MATRRVDVLRTLDIPLEEVSGICTVRRPDGVAVLAAVGDASSTLVWAKASMTRGIGRWHRLDLADAATDLPRERTQAEAVVADAGGLLLLLVEQPPKVLVFDIGTRQVMVEVSLTVPASQPIAKAWADDPNSLGEGLILLRDGRLLVVKEKRPAALMEFGPAGSQPNGVGTDQLLPLGAAWSPPAGPTATYEALATWPLDDQLAAAAGDLSDAAVGFDGRLYLLSDQSSVIVRPARIPPPGRGPVRAKEVLELRGKPDKAEGLALLPNGQALVALDTRKGKKNLLLVGPQVAKG